MEEKKGDERDRLRKDLNNQTRQALGWNREASS